MRSQLVIKFYRDTFKFLKVKNILFINLKKVIIIVEVSAVDCFLYLTDLINSEHRNFPHSF